MMALLAAPGRFLRVAIPVLAVLFALSGIWRFEGGFLGDVSALAWAGFGVVLVAAVLFGMAALLYRHRSRR